MEFGPGISAVVGPNGSGKSNLADALRWALGEQGRALRSRKAEDVIWAGSEKRAAQGMADVTLVLDNADGLLPVDFQVLELGRRLYRSGENEYLLNKQRIRLRDLVDLLDAAHLADNAFLFIGQGMVDQALALRPEERRPLFEEVAGVRRHERRRRQAEEQLVESEANLARVEDILGELRPQARRLAAQAEQQAIARHDGEELAAALLLAMHARWHEAAASPGESPRRIGPAPGPTVDGAMAELAAAEAAASALSEELGARARDRGASDARPTTTRARQLTATQLRDARLTSELEALERDRRRLVDERIGGRGRADRRATGAGRAGPGARPGPRSRARRRPSASSPTRSPSSRRCGRRARPRARSWPRSAGPRRPARPRRRPRDAAWPRSSAERPRKPGRRRRPTEQRAALEAELATVREELAAAIEAERGGGDPAANAPASGRARPRPSMPPPTSVPSRRARSAASARAQLDVARGATRRRGDARDRSGGPPGRGPPPRRGSRRRSGACEPPPRPPSPRRRAPTSSGPDAVPTLAAERGSLVVDGTRGAVREPSDARERRYPRGHRGGRWRDPRRRGPARHDRRRPPTPGPRRVAARTWRPASPSRPTMPPGWIVVTRDGSAIVTEVGVTFGAAESVLERRAEAARLAREVETLDAEVGNLRAVAVRLAAAARATADAVEAARAEESRTESARRAAEEAERLVARRLETVVREASWHEAQAERLAAELDRARAAVATLEAETPDVTADAAAAEPERLGGAGPR